MYSLESINEIISNAVKDSSYISVIISSSVFIIYTIIIRAVDLLKSKNRNKPIIEMAVAIKDVSENIVRLNNVLDRTFKDAEIKEAQIVRNIISLSFDSFKSNIIGYCNNIIIHNNIVENEEQIKLNVSKFVGTEYYKLYSLLSAYKINNVIVATKIKEEWINELAKECIDIIYNGRTDVMRISQLNSRLQVIINNYSVYILNKMFNH